MDTRDGKIFVEEELKKRYGLITFEEALGRNKFLKEMKVIPTEKQLARKPPKVGRNEPCPCGSGKKFKKCCLGSVK